MGTTSTKATTNPDPDKKLIHGSSNKNPISLVKNKESRKRLVLKFITKNCIRKIHLQIREKVNIQNPEIMKKGCLVVTKIPKAESGITPKFYNHFQPKLTSCEDEEEISTLLENLFLDPVLSGTDVVLISCYIYHLVLVRLSKHNCSTKGKKAMIFKTCVYIGQKYHLDNSFREESLAELFNVKLKKLLELESFVLVELLKFEINVVNSAKLRNLADWFV